MAMPKRIEKETQKLIQEPPPNVSAVADKDRVEFDSLGEPFLQHRFISVYPGPQK